MLTIAQASTLPHPRRGWATLTSFALQAVALAAALILPLLQPGILPRLDLAPHIVPLFLSPAVAPSVSHPASGQPSAHPHVVPFTSPQSIPSVIGRGPDTAAPEEEAPPCLQCVPGAAAGPAIPGGIGVIAFAIPVLPLKPVAKPLRISVIANGMLLHRVQPDYPIAAKRIRVQGAVEIVAIISREGTIEHLQVVSGHPMLVRAALDAVKQWRYRPYVLNGDPIEVETMIMVNFSLAGN